MWRHEAGLANPIVGVGSDVDDTYAVVGIENRQRVGRPDSNPFLQVRGGLECEGVQ
jgi:hypothetical protein